MKKNFLSILTVSLLLYPFETEAIVCDSGNYGQCHTIKYDSNMRPYCGWSGMEKDRCSRSKELLMQTAYYLSDMENVFN